MVLLWRILGYVVDLRPLTIVLILARKSLALESIEYFCNGLGRLCQHGLERDARLEFAVLFQVEEAMFQHCRNDNVVAGERATPI